MSYTKQSEISIYSMRSSYITNHEEGKDIYLIKKTWSSLELLHRHYDRSDVRRGQRQQRTYAKKQRRLTVIDQRTWNHKVKPWFIVLVFGAIGGVCC